tara:strand:- start:27265 stop:27435 length:171 start_codon:yes stop_codon:yes gene_type:complete
VLEEDTLEQQHFLIMIQEVGSLGVAVVRRYMERELLVLLVLLVRQTQAVGKVRQID